MPRWPRPLCACTKASAKVRAAALGSWYFWARASAASRLERHPGGERQPHEAARGEADALAQADDGIEHGARRAGERAAVEGLRVLGPAPAAQEARAVGLPFHRPLRPPFQAEDVHAPRAATSSARARPPPADEGGDLGQVLRLHEELHEGGMGQVVGGGGEHDLRVARDLDLARAIAVVGHGQAAHLHVVLGGDRDLELGADAVVEAPEGRLLGLEGDEVLLGLLADRDGGWPTTPTGCARRAGRGTGCPGRA